MPKACAGCVHLFLFFCAVMKDKFSEAPADYKQYRPLYPKALVEELAGMLAYRGVCWDCGTGNGQLALMLADEFNLVCATDISARQLQEAPPHKGILYSVQPAGDTDFPADFFDLVTVAQAIHWFDFDAFYAEVKRVLKPEGLLAVIGYNLLNISPAVDIVIRNFYDSVIGPYWDKERRYIDENYQTIPFPFEEIAMPAFTMETDWNFLQLLGYLNTWSAVKNYTAANGHNPVELIAEELQHAWGDEKRVKKVTFPLLLRVGRIS